MTLDPRALPKANLHLHLTGSMRSSTLAELAAGPGWPCRTSCRRAPCTGGRRSRAVRRGAGVGPHADDVARIVVEAAEDDAAPARGG